LPNVAKILYLNPSSAVGGAERSLFDLLKYLDKEKYYPIVSFPSEGKLGTYLEKRGIERKIIPFHPKISSLSRENGNVGFYELLSIPLYLLRVIIEIIRFIRAGDIDIVVTNGIKSHFIGSMVSVMIRAKLVWHVRDFIEAGWLKWILRQMGRFFPDRIITNSNAVGGIFPQNGRKETVYNGIDLSRFRLGINGEKVRSMLNIGKETKLVGTIGHLAPLKGFEELIEATGRVINEGFDIKLAIVGDAIYPNSEVYKQKLLSLVNSTGLKDTVIFTGYEENIPELLASFDIFVLPSRSEGFGKVNLEAMAMGKPVISTNVGGIPEVVLDGVTGILVQSGNSEDLAQAIMKLLNDRELRESLGREGRRRVEEHFTLQSHVQRIQEIYGEILQKG
jgi:glycosyltransferase involved in cell wall biosynthesis